MNSEGNVKLGEDIINMYKPYENKKTIWKKTKLNNQTFELPDYYEVISLSMNDVMQLDREPMEQLQLPSTIGCRPSPGRSPQWWRSRRWPMLSSTRFLQEGSWGNSRCSGSSNIPTLLKSKPSCFPNPGPSSQISTLFSNWWTLMSPVCSEGRRS